MIFNSYIFILAYLPIVIMIYFFLKKYEKIQFSKIFLVLASVLFIAYKDIYSAIFLITSIIINYVFSLFIKKYSQNRTAKIVSTMGVVFNILLLLYFKYTIFVTDSLNKFVNTNFRVEEIIIPVGISFITFQQISYLVDLYKRKITDLNMLDYLLYISYFPKLVQGPIIKYHDFMGQVYNNEIKCDLNKMSYGIWLFAQGLAKKVLLADTFAKAVNWGIGPSIEHMTAIDALLVSLSFTFQIYFDFSGYTNMAIGVSKMLNMDLPDNFDSPYQSKSVLEFWKKWHITLTNFLREYLYFPLGGNRKGKIRSYINVMIVFIISGLWHGASWTYIVWGLLHGVAYSVNKLFFRQWEKLGDSFRWICTFTFINISWIFFRALSVSQAVDIIKKIIRMETLSISESLLECFKLPEIAYLSSHCEIFGQWIGQYHGIEMLLFFVLAFVISLNIKDKCIDRFKPTFLKYIGTVIFLFWSIISLSTVVDFIYGGF